MKFITDILELEGKTIKHATLVDCDESIALVFTDYTCAFFDLNLYGDSHDIILINNPLNYLKRDAKIITEKEYDALQRIEQNSREAKNTEKELDMLAKLKAKYEIVNKDES